MWRSAGSLVSDLSNRLDLEAMLTYLLDTF
jgi:hypothetical protein